MRENQDTTCVIRRQTLAVLWESSCRMRNPLIDEQKSWFWAHSITWNAPLFLNGNIVHCPSMEHCLLWIHGDIVHSWRHCALFGLAKLHFQLFVAYFYKWMSFHLSVAKNAPSNHYPFFISHIPYGFTAVHASLHSLALLGLKRPVAFARSDWIQKEPMNRNEAPKPKPDWEHWMRV